MHHWLLSLGYLLSRIGTGIRKKSLTIDDDQNTIFSYYERGSPIPGQPSLIFIHGFSSDKESWLGLAKKIPRDYHFIILDLPYHGDTTGLFEGKHNADCFIDTLKMFFDAKNLTAPMCIIGTSMGGAIVAIFAVRYPMYVSMICLLAPPPTEEYESDLIKQFRSGMDHVLLPETVEQFYAMVDLLVVSRATASKLFLDLLFKSGLPYLDDHKRLLKSIMENEYLNLQHHYEQLERIHCPTLILWGRQDKLCSIEGAGYFSRIIPNSQVVIFDNCGHFISHDKCEEAANTIVEFVDQHAEPIFYECTDVLIKSRKINFKFRRTIAIFCLFIMFILFMILIIFLTFYYNE